MGRKPRRNLKKMTELGNLQTENEYLRAERCCSKVERTPIEGGRKKKTNCSRINPLSFR